MNTTPCPTCGTPCKIVWSGLDLVENSGDETLATKEYIPTLLERVEALKSNVAAQVDIEIELREENERLRYLLADVLAHHEQFGGLYSGLEERIKSTLKC